jgi:hypothetical protein
MNADTTLDNDAQDEQSEGSKVYVSLQSLAEDGTTPEVGDEVSFNVTVRVHSVEGDVACVTPETVNGEPAPQAPMNERDAMRAKMEAADEQDSY